MLSTPIGRVCVLLLILVDGASAYQLTRRPRTTPVRSTTESSASIAAVAAARATAVAASAAFSVVLWTSVALLPASASDTAAQISLDRLPPTSISIQIGDLPVVGSLLSGTYTKVPDGSVANPSVTIKSPKDEVKAISSIATGGHLEFDVAGKISTHLDVDIAADEPGTAKIIVKSNLVPKLPFKNLASSTIGQPTGGRESQWNIVTNLGSGEAYYYNAKTGVTQLGRPDKI